MFKVTENWIKAYQNGSGGWNRAQLESIGVEWPPMHGWIRRAEGKSISEVAKARFEMLKGRTLRVQRQERRSAQLPRFPEGSRGPRCDKSDEDARATE
jgi:predicted oxidoreductase